MNSKANIRDEERLLIELCRMEFNENLILKIRLFVNEITDWNYFRLIANAHGVTALVWNNLENLSLTKTIPDEVSSILRGSLFKSLGRNTFNTDSLGDVLRLLNTEKIKTVLLKGMALESSVYGNAGLRQMTDVDILISRDECLRARNILMKNGFKSLPVKSVFHKLILTDIGKHLPSLLRNGTSVEIHHELFGGRNEALTKLFYESSYQTSIRGEKSWVPQPQIFFLYLVKHLHFHEMNNDSQLRLYTDLVVMIENYSEEIINSELIKLASQADMSEILANHLAPLREFWSISFPIWMNDFIDKYSDQESMKKFLYFLKSPSNNPQLDRSSFYRHIIRDIPGLHRKTLFVLGDVFPTIKFMKNRYKCSSAWRVIFYYPHRIGKLLWLIRH